MARVVENVTLPRQVSAYPTGAARELAAAALGFGEHAMATSSGSQPGADLARLGR